MEIKFYDLTKPNFYQLSVAQVDAFQTNGNFANDNDECVQFYEDCMDAIRELRQKTNPYLEVVK